MDHQRQLFVSLAAILLGFGVLMVYSASITSRPTEFEQVYLSRHLVFLGLGLTAAAVASAVPVRVWPRLAPWLFLATIVLLVLVLVPGLGTRVKGAQRWIRFGPISGQPSELAKIALPLFLAAVIARRRERLGSWVHGLLQPSIPILIVVPLVLFEPDLGTSLFLATLGAVALFCGGWPVRNFILGGALCVPPVVYLVLRKPYQMQRISGFVDTWVDWTNAPYQLKQSLVTLGSSGVWGTGLGRGIQKLSFLPEANTDFIFAVIGEELGLVGMLTILAVWAALYLVGLQLLNRLERGSFEYIAAFTLLTQLFLQMGINVAVVTAMVPPKGIPHPLLSSGGSNLVVSILTLGLIVGLTRRPAADPERVLREQGGV